MINAVIVIREPGRLKPMNWYESRLPELPRPGDYLTISGPDDWAPLGEDLVVRRVWWLLERPAACAAAGGEPIGQLTEVFVECDLGEGPYSSAAWRQEVALARACGVEVEALRRGPQRDRHCAAASRRAPGTVADRDLLRDERTPDAQIRTALRRLSVCTAASKRMATELPDMNTEAMWTAEAVISDLEEALMTMRTLPHCGPSRRLRSQRLEHTLRTVRM